MRTTDFPVPEMSGADVLSLLLENDRKRVAKGKPSHFANERIKFTPAEWGLVIPWRVALECAFEDGLTGFDLLRAVLSGPTDGEAWEKMRRLE